jgi:ferredoxin
MARYKVIYDRKGCISALSCATLSPELFEINKKDNKADLVSGNKEEGKFTRIIDERELDEALEAARACPVNVIHVFNLDTGDKLV